MERFRVAMAAPASLPEFQGQVFAVPTAPVWGDQLAALEMKQGKIKRMRNLVQKKAKNGPNADGKMSREETKIFMDDYTMEVFTGEEMAFKKRAMAFGGFVHSHGSVKFYARAGEAFAKALLKN